ncbi:sulfotransferase family protein [Haliea sp. E17]|uniref:sulfotransferase family protein n=1 Tax=Haliea sp. E17 TaxID=3401576 RepID=UPI003AAA4AA2
MRASEYIAAAEKETGLTGFDCESFIEPFEFMLKCIDDRPEAEGILKALNNEIMQSLGNRLRVSDYLRQHPEIADAEIKAPIIVMGMPRTGTTAMSYLLDCDPRWRSLLNWEAMDSVPPPTTETLRSDPRCVGKKQMQEAILAQIPFAVPHWEWADGPTECIFVHAQDFKALSWESRVAHRDYADYMLHCDMESAYEYQKKVMRVLQSQAPGRWVLKMPSHSLHFTWALRAFPDAKFIWTHRNPYKALASLGNTISTAHLSGMGKVDTQFIHDTYPKQIAEHVNRPMRLRASLPEDKILDVYCAEFMRDPLAGMHKVYSWLGEDIGPAVEQSMRDWLAGDAERQSARPGYSLEDFGWTREGLAHHFEEYLERYPQAADA